MKLINTLTNNARQSLGIILEDGTKVNLVFRYSANQKGWFYSINYGSFTDYNRRLVVNPNMLREFRNIIPFGLACTSTDGYEPVFLNDFSSGRVALYILTIDDVDGIEAIISGAKTAYV